MVDATKIARRFDPDMIQDGGSLLGRLRGSDGAKEGLSTRFRSLGTVGDDLLIATNPNVASLTGAPIYNPALVPDKGDLDNAREVGQAAGNKLKKGVGSLAPAAVIAANAVVGGQQAEKAPNYNFTPIGQENGVFKAVSPAVDVAEKVVNVAGMATGAAEMVLPMLGGALGYLGTRGQKAKAFLNKPNDYLNPEAKVAAKEMTLGGHINNATMLGFTAISTFGVAKGFSAGLDSLKHMNEAITGVPADKVSTMALLTSNNVPDLVKGARRHLLQENVSRGAVNLLSLGLIGRSMMRKKAMGFAEFLVPAGVGMGIDILMGESALPFFAGVANAHKAGEKIPAQAYGEFLMAASTELKNRGPLGKRVAMLIGEEAATTQIAPGVLLAEIEANLQAHKHGQKGAFDARIDRAIATAEKNKVVHGAHAKLPTAHIQVTNQAPAQVVQPQVSMVDRIGVGNKQDIAAQGGFAKKVEQERAALGQGAMGVTVP